MSSDQPPYPQQPPQGPYGPPPQGPYGQQPPQFGQYGGGGYAPVPEYVPPSPYASWWARVAAVLIDGLIASLLTVVPVIVGVIVLAGATETTNTSLDETRSEITNGGQFALGLGLILLGVLIGLVFQIWNQGIRQGQGGQSLGKQLLGIKVIEMRTGEPQGAAKGVLRYVLYAVLANACFLDVLWPLWDAKKQTWHDMIVSSVVVKA
ncbi:MULTISPECIES: RDD family protein [Mumia]|uniref:RDD family protein n=1 Tax=Mumia TaxID=1546255 RepID=UPI001421623F|nr:MULTISPECIES: RDD family protein [unclassified Mumia]QMW67795.1 RDD family protein [Mumia sp. ZJ1417]